MIRNILSRIRNRHIPEAPPLEDSVRVLIGRTEDLICSIHEVHGVNGQFSAELVALLNIVNATEQMLPEEPE